MVKLLEEQKIALIKQERERRRLARLKQVRQQALDQAKAIRESVSQKKREVIEDIKLELHMEIEEAVEEIAKKGPVISARSLPRRSKSKNTPTRHSRRRPMTEEDCRKAKARNESAISRLREQRRKEKMEKEEKVRRRKEAERVANQFLKQSAL
ncbi:unnamed protein product [Caenorhabditis bovis]|uniref:Uncharacterized protein n=1 Tax=Caenorhabditis bovis TaxID=2654633 RepID=A0A8S1ESU7_9PELO|nr:unnamed protein product [Caenorhabditis bovis]